MMTRRRIVFSGLVQAVGFRWRARQAARLYGCTGWVRNEDDGTVTMEIQADEAVIEKVIRVLQNDRCIEITGMDSKTLPLEPQERSFRTDYSW